MYNNIERELKILVDEKIYKDILNSYDFHISVTQKNIYYDDAMSTIKKQNGAVRIRTIGDKKIFTLKIKKDAYTHYEYEKEISTTDINRIKDPEILGWKKKFNIPKKVEPIASFTTKRYICQFDTGELCVDKTIFANHTDYELEYEYSKEHDGISFFNSILSKYDLKWEKNSPSKIARAMND